MPGETIKVNQGLVDSQDPSTLASGEVVTARDCFYKPGNPALWSALGRVAYNSSAEAGPIIAARALRFADLTSIYVTLVGTKYRYGAAGLTGSFSDLVTGLAGTATSFDAIYSTRGDMHVLINGVDRNRTVQSGPVVGFHSMAQAVSPPIVQLNGGAGAGFTLTTGKAVSYWIEERVKDAAGNIIKRNISPVSFATFGQSPTTYPFRTLPRGTTETISTPATYKPRILHPPFVNSDTTHWAVFGTSATSVYPVGGEIGEATIATDFIDDLRTGTDPALTGTNYETIAISLLGVTVTSPKHGPAPIASTGDLFEGSLLLNDVSNPLYVAYSFWDEPHAFPPLFVIIIPAKKGDRVTGIASLDNYAVIMCRDSLWRLNSLPRQDDAAFSVSRVLSEIEGAHGLVGPKAFAKFSFGTGPRLAYVSTYGIVVTDGHDWSVLTSDFNWEANVEISQLSQAVLINYPRYYLLELRYASKGSTRNDKKLYLHYHPSHAKAGIEATDFRVKITGPINQDANDAFVDTVDGLKEAFDANQDGRLYRCHTGFVEPTAPGGMKMVVLTGDRYPGGLGAEATIRALYAHHQAAPGQTAYVRLVQRRANRPDDMAGDTIPLDRREATPIHIGGTGEAFQYGFEYASTTAQVALDYFAPFYQDAHRVEST